MPKPSGRYTITGSRGDDFIDGSTYAQALQDRGLSVNGNAGNDTIIGGSGQDILSGGSGNDYIYGALNDLVGTGDGTIVWDGGKGSDTLDLSALSYDEGNGTLIQVGGGAQSSGRIETNIDKDDASVDGPISYDTRYINNFQGFENYVMGDGNDVVYMLTGTGANTIWGGGGNDYLHAGDGNDTVFGGDGNDIIDGGWGNDTVYGGAGSDIFTWYGRVVGQYSFDVIKDFDIDGSDGSVDQIQMFHGWTIQWDPNSPDLLHGYLIDNGLIFGEVVLEGLTYADAASVNVFPGG